MIDFLSSYMRSRIGRIGALLSVLNYSQAVIGLLISFYLARVLGAEKFGVLSYGIVVGTFVYTAVNFGAERTLVRDLVQREDKAAILTSSLALRGGLGLLALAGMLVILLLRGPAGEKLVVTSLCTAAALFWALFPVAWFDARYQMHRQAMVTLGEKAVYGALIFWALIGRGERDVVLVAFFLLATRATSFAVQMVLAGRSFRPDRDDVRAVARNARWLLRGNALIVLAALANLLISHWNQLVLDVQLSSERLGYYALAFQMIAVVMLLQNQMLRIFFPRIAALTARDADPVLAYSRLRRFAAIAGGMSLLVVVPLYFAAPFIIDVLFTAEYKATLAPLRILCLWVVINGVARIVNAFLINLRLDKAFFWCALLAGGVAVVLGQILIPRFGESGVALALLISHPVSAVAQWAFVRRELGCRLAVAA